MLYTATHKIEESLYSSGFPHIQRIPTKRTDIICYSYQTLYLSGFQHPLCLNCATFSVAYIEKIWYNIGVRFPVSAVLRDGSPFIKKAPLFTGHFLFGKIIHRRPASKNTVFYLQPYYSTDLLVFAITGAFGPIWHGNYYSARLGFCAHV